MWLNAMRHFALGNPRLAAARLVGQPVLREIQLERERPRELLAEQHGRHGDLAIGDLAQRAAILPLHATDCWPCLGKLVSSSARMPLPIGTTARSRIHSGSASQGESVMKCCRA
jgi:hypothetical protein